DATLVFTLIGYATQEIAVANRQIVNAELATTALMLDEIVAVGYGTQSRASVSGAVSSLDTEEIVKSSASTTADMIVGKVAGINARLINTRSNTSFQGRVPRDGRPGAAAVIQVRNMGDPLFVVDGVPVTPHEFNQINAQDIDNISILKDASATIYGFRASNGV